ncbi:MAG: PrsW family intramembrane metalloprotease [Phycisphaerae bacterium]|nr:PrsW family intramembrane metalloprotease [Phycisphaerae bacterium]
MVVSIILLYSTLSLCGLILALVVWKYDLYRVEPWSLLLLAVALGAGFMYLAGRTQVGLLVAITSRGTLVSDTTFAFIAGSTEEIGKLLGVLVIFLCARKHFDEPIDGLIYGSMTGLGAALEESVAVLLHGPSHGFLPPQEPVRLAGHLVMGGIGGYGAGLWATRQPRGGLSFALWLAVAVTLHTIWDIVAFSAADHFHTYKRLRWHDNVTPMALMLGGMAVYRRLVASGRRLTREHLRLCDVPPCTTPRD